MKWLRLTWKAVYYPVRFTEFVIASLTLYIFIGAVVSFVLYRYDLHDALLNSVLWPVAKTQWAQDFSESKLDDVEEGMTTKVITALLGNPLAKRLDSASGDTYWIYSWREAIHCCDEYQGNFHRREIRFASNGVVRNVRREFDAD